MKSDSQSGLKSADVASESGTSIQRSANMARIRGVDTSPEVRLRKALWHAGLRFRLNTRVEGFRPDLVFKGRRIAIFVDGCFWHGCPLHYVMPRTKAEFWAGKLAANTSRDRIQTRQLFDKGWIVLRYWEHELSYDLSAVVKEISILYRNPSIYQAKARKVVTRVCQASPDGTVENWHIEDLLEKEAGIVEVRSRRAKQS
ncbi:very short patch repair endonuclease [Phytopseudomonas seleniipraecipitans]|uniref:T/G mismatch-specific endonuclease n=1 Tax=Phytopseudomonas seleniipraecipitans TaxID=640205 RepID=A0A1G7T3E8_9GAMM|nr:very short patch repair endonuclease [Pseudomonas seleniipraecipitans]SDG29564.1 T/G mismatch-specific endonuclease [Pseudomonas seleniipraecipitans]